MRRKLNARAKLQTFSYSTVSKQFLYSNIFMAKSTNQQMTDKKLNVFGAAMAAGETQAPSNLAW